MNQQRNITLGRWITIVCFVWLIGLTSCLGKSKECYDKLGVKEDASEKEIKKKFRKLALQYHPDKQRDKSEKERERNEEKFKELVACYESLVFILYIIYCTIHCITINTSQSVFVFEMKYEIRCI